MKALATSFLLLILLVFSPQTTFAFGSIGHRIIATIAMHYLSPTAKQNVQRILGSINPEQAATWMDEMRGSPAYDYMKPWHYINMEKGYSYEPGGNNIITALEKAYSSLAHVDPLHPEEHKTSLMVLFHLMGDLHQPLHVGYAADKGGNTVQVRLNGRGTNLHHVWDDDIIESQHITAEECLSLSYPFLSDIIQAGFTPSKFVDYLNASRALVDNAYAFSGNEISEAYLSKNKKIIETQLLLAGVRLAAVLQQALGDKHLSVSQNDRVISKGASTTITPEDAAKHIGEEVTVCGKVFGGKYLQGSKSAPTFINIGAAYPNSPFTVVIFGDDRGNFSYKPETYLDGKTICVKGIVKEYKGKAEIIVSKEMQIQIQ